MLGLKLPDKGNKRKAAGPAATGSEGGIKELLDLVAKLSLANALSSRVLKSIVLDVMHVPITNEIVQAMMTATKNFAEAHRPASKEERDKMGMPHHHAWNAMLEKIAAEAPLGIESRAIKDYSDFVKNDPVKICTAQVRHVRVCKCYDKTMKKLEVNCFPGSQSYLLWQVLKDYLKGKGCKELPGIAPMGDLERRIQKAIDDHKGDMDE